jgi:hypothetical protein
LLTKFIVLVKFWPSSKLQFKNGLEPDCKLSPEMLGYPVRIIASYNR